MFKGNIDREYIRLGQKKLRLNYMIASSSRQLVTLTFFISPSANVKTYTMHTSKLWPCLESIYLYIYIYFFYNYLFINEILFFGVQILLPILPFYVLIYSKIILLTKFLKFKY